MKRCEEFVDAMAAEVAGEIDSSVRDGLMAHLQGCPSCASQAARLRDALGGLRSEAVPDPGPVYWAAFDRRLRERIAVSRRHVIRRTWLLAAAALVVAGSLGIVIGLRRAGGGDMAAVGGAASPAVAGARAPEGAAAVPDAATAGATTPGGDQQAEARFEEILREIRAGKAAETDTDLETILEEIAPGDPFALAGGWDDDSIGAGGGPGV